jgi:type IV secretion system protein VirB11
MSETESLASTTMSLDDLEKRGFFSQAKIGVDGLSDVDMALLHLLALGEYNAFLKKAVQNRKSIVVCGGPGSGKTILKKALLAEIPVNDRVLVIEKTPELSVPRARKEMVLLQENATPDNVLPLCIENNVDVIVQDDLQEKNAVGFLNVLLHSKTSVIAGMYAGSAQQAFSRLAQWVAQDPAAETMSQALLIALLKASVDVVVCIERGKAFPYIAGIWYDPPNKLTQLQDEGVRAAIIRLGEHYETKERERNINHE